MSFKHRALYAYRALPPPDQRNWRDYLLFIPRYVVNFILRVLRVFGWRFIVFLCASQLCLKGCAYYLSLAVALPLLKNVFGISAYHFQLYMMITMLPWSIKPILGLLSDFFLIGGYHKRFWLFNALGVGAIGCGLLFLAYPLHSAIGIALCFMGVQYEVALFDLMSEGAYSAAMRKHSYTGSDLVVVTQVFQHVGGIIAMCMIGPMADANLFYPLFIINAVMCCTPLIPSIFGWLPEEKYPYGIPHGSPDCCSKIGVHPVEHTLIEGQRWIIGVIAFTGLSAPVAVIVSNAIDAGYGLVLAILMMSASLMGAYFVFPRLVFNVALYQVVCLLGAPSIGGAMDYFYTSGEECVPGGPHFSFKYYQTYAGLVGTVCALFGTILYQILLSRMRFRYVFLLTAVLKALIGLSDLFIVTRTNIKWGISDHVAYIIGEAVMEPVLSALNYIPAMALLSRVSIEGMESSTFAFLAGINNFAAMISNMSGAFIFRAAGVKTELPCDFDSLWILILCCHCIGPMVTGVGFSWLIPATPQNSKLNADGTISSPDDDEIKEISLDDDDDEEKSPFSDDDENLLTHSPFSSMDCEMELL